MILVWFSSSYDCKTACTIIIIMFTNKTKSNVIAVER